MHPIQVTEQYKGFKIHLSDLRVVSESEEQTQWACNLNIHRPSQHDENDAPLVDKEIYVFTVGNGMDSMGVLAIALGKALLQIDICIQ